MEIPLHINALGTGKLQKIGDSTHHACTLRHLDRLFEILLLLAASQPGLADKQS